MDSYLCNEYANRHELNQNKPVSRLLNAHPCKCVCFVFSSKPLTLSLCSCQVVGFPLKITNDRSSQVIVHRADFFLTYSIQHTIFFTTHSNTLYESVSRNADSRSDYKATRCLWSRSRDAPTTCLEMPEIPSMYKCLCGVLSVAQRSQSDSMGDNIKRDQSRSHRWRQMKAQAKVMLKVQKHHSCEHTSIRCRLGAFVFLCVLFLARGMRVRAGTQLGRRGRLIDIEKGWLTLEDNMNNTKCLGANLTWFWSFKLCCLFFWRRGEIAKRTF